jgi:hypothetical protein
MNLYGNLKQIKEIASEIGRSRTFVHGAKKAMEEAGIAWPMNMMSTECLVHWIRANGYTCTDYARKKPCVSR